jgi:hypothetical protein
MDYLERLKAEQIERCKSYGSKHIESIRKAREARLDENMGPKEIIPSQATEPIKKDVMDQPDWLIDATEQRVQEFSVAYADLLIKLKKELSNDEKTYRELLFLLLKVKHKKPQQLPNVPERHVHLTTDAEANIEAKYTCVDGRPYPTSRYRWYAFYMKEPLFIINHVDGNKRNNRITNLQDLPIHTKIDKIPPEIKKLHKLYYSDLPVLLRVIMYKVQNQMYLP